MSYLNISGRLDLSFSGVEAVTVDGVPYRFLPNIALSQTVANGLVAVADAWDLYFIDTARVLTPSASHTYVLSALVDTLPRTLAFTKVRAFILVPTIRTAGDYLTLKPAVSNGWTAMIPTDTIKVYGGYANIVDKTDSFAVASGSNDSFTITNAGSANITFDLLIGGCSG